MVSKRYLKEEFTALQEIVSANAVIVDAGAHIGLHSVLMSRIIGPGGVIYAFEPVKDTYWKLRETLALNRIDNVIAVQSALKDTVGFEKMNIFPEASSEWNSFGIPATNEDRPIAVEEVPTNTLDSFAKERNISHIDFLKIDVEGVEKYVFRGAKRLLNEKRIRIISFEVSQAPLEGTNSTAKELFDTLESYGYISYEFDPQTNTFLGPIKDSHVQHKNYYASYTTLK